MWKVYKYNNRDNKWYCIGSYDTIDYAASVVKTEIYLENCVCNDNGFISQFKIESDLK